MEVPLTCFSLCEKIMADTWWSWTLVELHLWQVCGDQKKPKAHLISVVSEQEPWLSTFLGVPLHNEAHQMEIFFIHFSTFPPLKEKIGVIWAQFMLYGCCHFFTASCVGLLL